MTRIVVVGAGITGLAAAWRLRRHVPDADVLVLDAAGRAGGLVHTSPFDGVPLDTAADAFLARVPEAVALCVELGLGDQLVHPTDAGALVLTDTGLRRLPPGLVLGVPTDLGALEASGIVSPAGVERARHDPGPLVVPTPGDTTAGTADVSVGAMVRHRLGDEVMDELVAPLLGGVNAGDADRLSLAAGAPQLAAVADAPDLLAALRANAPAASIEGGSPPPVFAGFTTGTSTLVDALVNAIGTGAVHLHTTVTAIRPILGGGFRLDVTRSNDDDGGGSGGGGGASRGDGDSLDADAVVLAAPAHVSAALVASLDGDLVDVADGLDAIEWASVAMVSLAVETQRVTHPLDASGYLVPTTRRRTVTAASFASTKWAHLARPGRALLRVSAGHAGDEAPLDLSDDELTAAVCADLGEHIGLDGPPADAHITRWWRALPQYRPGHLTRAAQWQGDVWSAHPGLWLTGASFAGLGLPACIRQGNEAAARVARHLGHTPP